MNIVKDSLEKIIIIVKDNKLKTFDDFIDAWQIQGTILLELQTVGENFKHIPQEVVNQFKNIPLLNLRDMRHDLAHDYPGINLESAWELIVQSPKLKKEFYKVADYMGVKMEDKMTIGLRRKLKGC
ncbi:MAG: DUF86 domain-containing protein [Flavobacteriaceae bacterium]|nr:DUF86 domain-containing protein [Flavobacteriaceae bacterium]